MTAKFETRNNPATSNLDIKDPTTGAWVQAIAKLRTAGGDDVKLIPEQLQLIQDIKSILAPLSQIAKTVSDSQADSQAISTEIKKVQTLLSSIADSNTFIRNELDAIAASISAVTAALNRNSDVVASLASALNSVPQSLVSIQEAIANLANIPELLEKSTASAKFSTTILLDTINTEKSVPLPDGTKTLYFSARKNELGQSFDIRHAMKSGEVASLTGKYETLWAYSEFRESNLYLKNATLYLACSSIVTIEVHAWY